MTALNQENTQQYSCIACRQRKKKCNKVHPCEHCTKIGIYCVFRKRGRRAVAGDPRPLEQTQTSEYMLHQVTEHGLSQLTRSTITSPYHPRQQSCRGFFKVLSGDKDVYIRSRLRLSILDQSIELLNRDSTRACNVPTNHQRPLPYFDPASIPFPTPTQSFFLWEIYKENVAPIITILHKPTIATLLSGASVSSDILPPDSLAVLWAIYLSSVISMSNEQCLAELSQPRSVIIGQYKSATDNALRQAHLLRSPSLLTMQAAVLYLSCIRRNSREDSEHVWATVTVLLRVAKNMRLHQDGSFQHLSPFETEMRRRLWWHLCLLDVRSSEEQGTEPQTFDMPFDTQIPSNINDDDICPDSTRHIAERVGYTEMTFTLIRCEMLKAVYQLGGLSQNNHDDSARLNPDNSRTIMQTLEHRLEEYYIRYCNPRIPLHRMCIDIARIIPKVCFILHHPLDEGSLQPSGEALDRFFVTAIESIECSRGVRLYDQIGRWAWFFGQNPTRWYILAFVLTELCVRPKSPFVDRAWCAVNYAYQTWGVETMQDGSDTVIDLMKRASIARNLGVGGCQ